MMQLPHPVKRKKKAHAVTHKKTKMQKKVNMIGSSNTATKYVSFFFSQKKVCFFFKNDSCILLFVNLIFTIICTENTINKK